MDQVLKEELINELLRKNSTRIANSLSYIDVQEMVLDIEWKFDELACEVRDRWHLISNEHELIW